MIDDQQLPDRPKLYHYKLDKILGRGGSGIVYRGSDTHTGAIVAVKLFNASFFKSRLHRRDFAKSVERNFNRLNHPNVIRVYDFVSGDEGDCLSMEYADGPDLKKYIENRPWNLQERLVIVAQICNGLQYIHDQGITHHDLKPANILFTRRGQVKLSDYSLTNTSLIASLIDGTSHDQITPMFIAPELIRKEKATPQSDIYSLGITLYILFTERSPFEVDTLDKLRMCHLRVTPQHPSLANYRCPQALGSIIMRMIDKKPENRFQDCDELRIALSDIGLSRI